MHNDVIGIPLKGKLWEILIHPLVKAVMVKLVLDIVTTTQNFPALLRRIPQQLTRDETDTIRKLLADPKFSHWGITSLTYYAMQKNLVMTSPATWYKYNQLLGIRKRGRKKGNRTADAAILFRAKGYLAK
jgi:hypothetical protein